MTNTEIYFARNFHVVEMINSINSNYGYEALKINENVETN